MSDDTRNEIQKIIRDAVRETLGESTVKCQSSIQTQHSQRIARVEENLIGLKDTLSAIRDDIKDVIKEKKDTDEHVQKMSGRIAIIENEKKTWIAIITAGGVAAWEFIKTIHFKT